VHNVERGRSAGRARLARRTTDSRDRRMQAVALSSPGSPDWHSGSAACLRDHPNQKPATASGVDSQLGWRLQRTAPRWRSLNLLTSSLKAYECD
jgi:hypothetical protein